LGNISIAICETLWISLMQKIRGAIKTFISNVIPHLAVSN